MKEVSAALFRAKTAAIKGNWSGEEKGTGYIVLISGSVQSMTNCGRAGGSVAVWV